MRYCPKCDEETERVATSDRCAACASRYNKKYKRDRKDQANAPQYCPRCDRVTNRRNGASKDCVPCSNRWRRENYKNNRERELLYHREYSKSNREKRNATNQRRKAIKRGAEGNISSKEWELVLGFYGKCASCGSEENLTMDHVVPLW
jgi:5-methylcytosine-specific restriction endonuclease McrA